MLIPKVDRERLEIVVRDLYPAGTAADVLPVIARQREFGSRFEASFTSAISPAATYGLVHKAHLVACVSGLAEQGNRLLLLSAG